MQKYAMLVPILEQANPHNPLTILVSPAGRPGGPMNFPGGKIEPGEYPMMAALREFREETGLHIPGNANIAAFVHGPGYEIHVFTQTIQVGLISNIGTPELLTHTVSLRDIAYGNYRVRENADLLALHVMNNYARSTSSFMELKTW